ncbi:hypothetical protein ACWCPM_10690 [Streptomyces sp. NPDC002309]
MTVRKGRVGAGAGAPGSGPIAEGTAVPVGRDAGARGLRRLSVGERAAVRRRLVASVSRLPYRFRS